MGMASYEVTPEEFGLKRTALDDLRGGDGAENAKIAKRILTGEKGPKRDIVLLNAGAALYIARLADSVKEGILMAEESIDSGNAMRVLQELEEMSNAKLAMCG